jgi:hypothetical protein
MAHREFRDENGRTWQAWDVIPSAFDAGVAADEARPSDAGPERRRSRRRVLSVAAEMRGGWLAFQSQDESRRLAPIPAGWAKMSDAELAALVRGATPSTKTERISKPQPKL